MSTRAPKSKRNFIAILREVTDQRIVEAPPQESSQEPPKESLARSDRFVSRLVVGLMTAMCRRAAKAG
jgi:hypothetical protein